MEVIDPTYSNQEVEDPTYSNESQKRSKWKESKRIIIKVGMIGEMHTGKVNIMIKLVEDSVDNEYIESLGVNFIEKTVRLKNIAVTLSFWDLGGRKEYRQLMPLLCNDARVLLFVFDLTRKRTLSMVRRLFKIAKKQNKYAIPFLIGSKFDLFNQKDMEFKQEITNKAQKFAKLMRAPLIFCSSSRSINIQKIFQIIIARVFHLKPRVTEVKKVGEPILEYKASWPRRKDKTKSSPGRRGRKDEEKEEKHPG